MNNHRLKEIRKYIELRGISLNSPIGKHVYKTLKQAIKDGSFDAALHEFKRASFATTYGMTNKELKDAISNDNL